jgi:glutathione S-transferase
MRARLAISYSASLAAQSVELREVVLKNKPQAMLDVSAKATVPVLVLNDGRVIDESLDIMLWALNKNTQHTWLSNLDDQLALINQCDNHFKPWLDKYKYADRHLSHSQSYYREQAEVFLVQLEQRLVTKENLFGNESCLSDAAIFPFVRQFAHVDKAWFEQAPYPKLQAWLAIWIDSLIFKGIMNKYAPWEPNQEVVLFPSITA